MRLVGVMLLGGLCALRGDARADPGGAAGGRLVLRVQNSEISLAAARAAVGGESLVLELRRGTQVLEATLDEDGYFWVNAPAGTYRLEYLRVGKRAEFFAPQTIVVQPGALTCAGTVALELDRIEELGANVNNRVAVTDQCGETMPRLRATAGSGPRTERVAIASPGPLYEHYAGLGWRDVLVGLRAEAAIGPHIILRGLFRLPPVAHTGFLSRAILLFGFGGLRGDRDEIAYDATLGAGGHVLFFDMLAIGGVRWPDVGGVATGPVVGGVLRINSVTLGLGLRVEVLPKQAAFFTVDLAPFGVLGSLL